MERRGGLRAESFDLSLSVIIILSNIRGPMATTAIKKPIQYHIDILDLTGLEMIFAITEQGRDVKL